MFLYIFNIFQYTSTHLYIYFNIPCSHIAVLPTGNAYVRKHSLSFALVHCMYNDLIFEWIYKYIYI